MVFFKFFFFQGDFHALPRKVQQFVAEKADLMRPRGIYICDGSQHEADEIIHKLVERGMLSSLPKYINKFIFFLFSFFFLKFHLPNGSERLTKQFFFLLKFHLPNGSERRRASWKQNLVKKNSFHPKIFSLNFIPFFRIVTPNRFDTECRIPEGEAPLMGHWMNPETFSRELDDRFPGCMAGKENVLLYKRCFSNQ